MSNKFKIIVPFYNVEKWIKFCAKSIKLQDYQDYMCYMTDDMSTDESLKNLAPHIAGDPRFILYRNGHKRFALGNICDTMERQDFDDEDIIVVVDGDDWLATEAVLSKLNEIYEKEDCLMTYGSFVYYPSYTRGGEASEYPADTIKNNSYRKDQWRGSHLRTFKYKVWKEINHEDLRDTDGEYFEMTYDQAMMLPMLEMCGPKAKYVSDILYVYNSDNPNAVNKTRAKKQYNIMLDIRKKKPYDRIFK